MIVLKKEPRRMLKLEERTGVEPWTATLAAAKRCHSKIQNRKGGTSYSKMAIDTASFARRVQRRDSWHRCTRKASPIDEEGAEKKSQPTRADWGMATTLARRFRAHLVVGVKKSGTGDVVKARNILRDEICGILQSLTMIEDNF